MIVRYINVHLIIIIIIMIIIMRECVNWVSVTAFISASPATDNYTVEQL